ncbi:MAG: hypothetical protein ACREPI_13135 [Candidatus Dormibacterales bacterium]
MNEDLSPLRIQWGEKRQADGSWAKVYRLVDKVNDRYIEDVSHADSRTLHQNEPLSEHRGHGSAREKHQPVLVPNSVRQIAEVGR